MNLRLKISLNVVYTMQTSFLVKYKMPLSFFFFFSHFHVYVIMAISRNNLLESSGVISEISIVTLLVMPVSIP